MISPGRIVVLNGAPRSGKSSIAAVIQDRWDGPWMALGVDWHAGLATPPRYRPGIGLRPGGEHPEVAALVPTLYAALYEAIADHARLGLNVVVDVGHHLADPAGLDLLRDCARRLTGLPALLVGVTCPIAVIMQRRNAGQPGREGVYLTGTLEAPVPEPVRLWQAAVTAPDLVDLAVDTAVNSPSACAATIRSHLDAPLLGPSAFERLASG